jgi:hypothetical protein
MPHVYLAGLWEVVPDHASLARILTDPASLFGYMLLAIAAAAVWWGDRQAKKNSKKRPDEQTDEARTSPRPRAGEGEDEATASNDE